MPVYVNATNQDGQDVSLQIDRFPDNCPVCRHGIEPMSTGQAHVTYGGRSALQVVFKCPRSQCQSFFISSYTQRYFPGSRAYFFFGSAPYNHIPRQFSDHIATISPMFCIIFNESQGAESEGWKLIAGPGYRKALEFLVKDYLCTLKPSEADKIKATQLGPCIEAFVDNDKVKQTAKRAAWLGNDETHYVRKWEDHDLSDLKNLTELTVRWIEMEEMTTHIVAAMPHGKKP